MRNMRRIKTTTDKPHTFYPVARYQIFQFYLMSQKKYWVQQPSSIDLFFWILQIVLKDLYVLDFVLLYITQSYAQSLEWWYFQSPLQSFLQLLVVPLIVFCNKVTLINSRFSTAFWIWWIISSLSPPFPIWKIGFNECALFWRTVFLSLLIPWKLSFL